MKSIPVPTLQNMLLSASQGFPGGGCPNRNHGLISGVSLSASSAAAADRKITHMSHMGQLQKNRMMADGRPSNKTSSQSVIYPVRRDCREASFPIRILALHTCKTWVCALTHSLTTHYSLLTQTEEFNFGEAHPPITLLVSQPASQPAVWREKNLRYLAT